MDADRMNDIKDARSNYGWIEESNETCAECGSEMLSGDMLTEDYDGETKFFCDDVCRHNYFVAWSGVGRKR